jgi:hypothetical protein
LGMGGAATAVVPTPVWLYAEGQGPDQPRQASGFLGRPDPGFLYYGASVPSTRSLTAWEGRLGEPLSLHRSYFEADQTPALLAQVADDLRHRRLPHVSIKPPGAWSDVAGGRRDRWLHSLLEGLAHPRNPVLLTIHHEPQNDAGGAGMRPADFVAMQRRALRRAASLAPNVTVVPVHQYWLFDRVPRVGTPTSWLVEDAAAFGVDVYNPWSPTNGKRWRSFESAMEEILPWSDAKPICIGEYGCRRDPADPQRSARWLAEAFSFARSHNVVSMSYFNSHRNSPDGTWELSGVTEATFAHLLRSPSVVRPS